MSDRSAGEHERGPADVSTSDRMAQLGSATADAMKRRSRDEHETRHGARHQVPLADAERIVASWPEAPQKAARQMLEQYGAPNEATPTKLFWYERRPWKRIMATSDVLLHNFPSPHTDFVTHWIDYRVPVEMVESITRFDGSCLVDRTAGEVAARCDSEAANVITLNMMHEIVTGKRTVKEARETQAENMVGYTLGRPAPYAERLLFEVQHGGTEDPDEDMGMGPMAHQAFEKVKDVLTGRDREPTDR